MELITGHFSAYIIPPALSLIAGWTLALVSLIKGRFRSENILFSFVCIWLTLMPVIYISHHLFRGNLELILSIERSIHFFYVYLPFITFIYLQKSFGFKNRPLIIFSLLQSIVISFLVPTNYYIRGFYTYNWGYSATGGIAFKIFGASAMLYITYVIWFFIAKLRTTVNTAERLKLKYILFSFIVIGILMILNMPSIIGINFYAFGNFMFVPLLLMAYGVLRYRLMDIRSVLHITFVWTVISSLIIIPNIYIYRFARPFISATGDIASFTLLFAWFFLNYYYFVKIKPLIDRLFNRQKFNLMKSESLFIESVSLLKNRKELTELFTGTLRTILHFRNAEFFLKSADDSHFENSAGEKLVIDNKLHDWFISSESFIDLNIVAASPDYISVREKLKHLFATRSCCYIMPFVYNRELAGIAFIDERVNMKELSPAELKFLNSIGNSISISISNSVMYQNLSDLKDHLEDKVIKRTEELLNAMQRVEEMNRQLVDRNSELSEARRIAEMDMLMAVNVQKSIFPHTPQNDPGWDTAVHINPMSGVSGDLYDFYTEDGRLAGLMLLDVSGHGIASGLITMIARSIFYRNFFSGTGMNLGAIMNRINDELINEISKTEKYITAILLRFKGSRVEYANAAHPDIVLRRKRDMKATVIDEKKETGGSILGVSGLDKEYNTMEFTMEEGDVLVAFSDGLIEGKNRSGRCYGFTGISAALESTGTGSAADILNYIISDYNNFRNGEAVKDDMTVIVAVKK